MILNKISVLLLSFCLGLLNTSVSAQASLDKKWNYFHQQKQVNDLVTRLSAEKQPQTLVIQNVSIVNVETERIEPGKTVLISEGKIQGIYDQLPSNINGARVINGKNKFLMPGLCDAHVHTSKSNDEKILNLFNGITTVREMAGSSWMIPYREQIRQNKILAPNLYLSGPMFNYFDLGIYSEVVRSKDEIRAKVAEHKQTGYDFIKVWNKMPLPFLKTLGEEASKNNLALVGHIPHDVPIADALGTGMRTLEHFKGYLYDNKLTLSTEDFVAATRELKNVWLTPTAVCYRQQITKSDDAPKMYTSPEMKYVPALLKETWAAVPEDEKSTLRTMDSLVNTILKKLAPVKPDWLVGTDNNGSNPFMIPGIVVHQEMKMMKAAGVTDIEIIRAATVNVAKALGRENEFGAILPGRRADLLLLEKNPLDNIENVFQKKSVIVRGIYFSPEEIKSGLAQLEKIYNQKNSISATNKAELLKYYKGEQNPFINPLSIVYFNRFLLEAGLIDDAIAMMQVQVKRFPLFNMFNALGDGYFAKQDTPKALENYKAALQLNKYSEYAAEKVKALDH